MEGGSIIAMLIGLAIIWGGLAYTINLAIRTGRDRKRDAGR
ncbi:MAG: MetS family NSS transporter small subunit [Actinobacteria bacterium]|nr:MetS family NSS transporter small subunit [Actinomycetota bacterium]